MKLQLQNVSKIYPSGNQAVCDMNLTVNEGELVVLVGPSGCGKTTTLRMIAGLETITSGELRFDDRRQNEASPRQRGVAMVFQTPAPFPFSIYRNMTYALRYYGVRDKKELDRQVREKLEMAGLYEEVSQELDKSAHKLSGGQQQRLCIARALTVEPEVLLLDEPCSALDVKSSSVIERMLVQLKERYTIVIVTHNIAQARRISDHVAFLFGGRLVEFGTTAQIFSEPREEQTRDFLEGIYG